MRPPMKTNACWVCSGSVAALESLALAAGHDETQLPCSPRSLFTSNIAAETMSALDKAEAAQAKRLKTQVGFGQSSNMIKWFDYMLLNNCIVQQYVFYTLSPTNSRCRTWLFWQEFGQVPRRLFAKSNQQPNPDTPNHDSIPDDQSCAPTVLDEESQQVMPEPLCEPNQPTQAAEKDQANEAVKPLPKQTEAQVVTRRQQFETKASKKQKNKETKALKQQQKKDKERLKLEKQQARKENNAKKKNNKQEAKQGSKQPRSSLGKKSMKKKKQKDTSPVHSESQGSSVPDHHGEDQVGDDVVVVEDQDSAKSTEFVASFHCKRGRTAMKPKKHRRLSLLQKALPRKGGARSKHMKQRAKNRRNTTEAKLPTKRTSTGTGKNRSNKGKTQAKEEPPVDAYVQKVAHVLQECRTSHCTHPSWQDLVYDKKAVQLSVYWNRCCVGVKVPKQNAKKGSKCKFQQIAYFGCPTSCVYSNLALAHIYVITSDSFSMLFPLIFCFACFDLL